MTEPANSRDPFAQPQTYREALAVHEALRRLGFASADIYVSFGPSDRHGPDVFHVVLRAPQRPEFSIPVGQLAGQDETRVYETWIALSSGVTDGTITDAALARVWADSRVARGMLALTGALIEKGVVPPRFAALPQPALDAIVRATQGTVVAPKVGMFFGLACVECSQLTEVCELPIWEAAGKSLLALPAVLQEAVRGFLAAHEGHTIEPEEFEISKSGPGLKTGGSSRNLC